MSWDRYTSPVSAKSAGTSGPAKTATTGCVFRVGGQTVEKELAVGDGFMRVSEERPGWSWSDILLQPAEPPFGPDSPVRSIRIDYPDRDSWTAGTDWWLAYSFAASMFFAFCFRPLLKVNL